MWLEHLEANLIYLEYFCCVYYQVIILILKYCLVEPDKNKRKSYEIKLNEYAKRAEELKAILQLSDIKTDCQETADESSASSEYDDPSKKLSKNKQTVFEKKSIIHFLKFIHCKILIYQKMLFNCIL